MNTSFLNRYTNRKIKHCTHEFEPPLLDFYSEDEVKDIYENPNSIQIRSNIHTKQNEILNDYYDMGFIASIADNLFVLTPPVKVLFNHTQQYANEKYEADSTVVKNNFEKNIKASKKLDKKVSYRSMLFSSISKVYPDFCCNMAEKVGTEKYALYHKARQSLKKVLTSGSSSSIDAFSAEILLSYKDKLSSVIDTPQFSEACSIEDEFVISEIEAFFEALSKMPKEKQKPFHRKKVKIGEDYFSTIELSEKIKTERLNRLKKYSEIQKLYRKLENHPYIKLSVKDDESR